LLRDRTREELRRKQLELNEARTLQLSLVPPRFSGAIAGRGVSIDILLEPAKEVGGDLVDHFQLDGNLVVLCLGDVSDKGAGSALMMARTHAMVRALAARPDAPDLFRRPDRAVSLVNASLCEGNLGCMFVTFVLASLDVATGRLAYVRAGHIPPYLRRATGAVERLDQLSGPPLGIVETARYQVEHAVLEAGDRLLILTDGFTEAQDAAQTLFGDARVADFMASQRAAIDGALQHLYGAVRAFEQGQPAFDDMAAILLGLDGAA
jgi:sigma-B regulation protein RsbU (phosphoserine phosphatase)